MFENITIGQYYHQNTWLYKINPTIKLLMTILFITIIFLIPFSENYLILSSLSILLLIQILVVIFSKIPILKVIKGIFPLFTIMALTLVLQVLTYSPKQGEIVLFTYNFNISYLSIGIFILSTILYFILNKFFSLKYLFLIIYILSFFIIFYFLNIGIIKNYEIKVYKYSLLKSYYLIFRVINTIFATSILTLSTSTTKLTQAFENIFKPLKIIKFPAEMFAIMMGLTFRFVPTLIKETIKIIKAQKSRGLDINHVNIFKKVQLLAITLIPLFISSIKKANDIADCMEVRGFLIDSKRTKIDIYDKKITDYFFLSIVLITLITLIILRILIKVYNYDL